jgi:hypothetical protein
MPGHGGLKVTAEMEAILKQPGHISIKMGSEKLRAMFQTREFLGFRLTVHSCHFSSPSESDINAEHPEFGELDINKLSPFAFACITGQFQDVKAVRLHLYVVAEILIPQSRQSVEGLLPI